MSVKFTMETTNNALLYVGIFTSFVGGTRGSMAENFKKAIAANHMKLENYLFEDSEADPERHCDWVFMGEGEAMHKEGEWFTRRKTSYLNDIMQFLDFMAIGPPLKSFLILSRHQLNYTNMNNLVYNSVCLFFIASAQNRVQLEEQLALGKSLQFKKGKLSMIIMSELKLDLINVTKVPFPTMLLEAGLNKPRECQYDFCLGHK